MSECTHDYRYDDDGRYCTECDYRETFSDVDHLAHAIIEDGSILEDILSERDKLKAALKEIHSYLDKKEAASALTVLEMIAIADEALGEEEKGDE